MSTRRSLLKAFGVGIATSSVLGTAAAKGRSGANSSQPFHRQLRKVEQATKRFTNLDQALREGYRISGPYVPGMGWHVTNPAYVQKAAEHGPGLVEPPILTYNLDLELGSVEYAVPVPEGHGHHDSHTPNLFNDEESDHHPHHGPSESEARHVHGKAQHIFSNHDGEYNPGAATKEELLDPVNWVELSAHIPVFPDPDWSLEAGDTLYIDGEEWGVIDVLSVHPSMNTLHAWVHYENPAGVFAGRNPEFDHLYEGGHDHSGHEH